MNPIAAQNEDWERSDSRTRRYDCPPTQCGKWYTAHHSLMKHLDKHAGTRYRCKTCHKTFARRDDLKRHDRSKHDDGQVECAGCGKTLSRAEYIPVHIRSTRYAGCAAYYPQFHVRALHDNTNANERTVQQESDTASTRLNRYKPCCVHRSSGRLT